MPRYQQQFNLDVTDIDLIERALRGEIARHSVRGNADLADPERRAQMRAINEVLGKIHNQKIFYAQVKVPGVPAG
ncbi:MAG: hypothetical protein RLW61_20950 [Gammaproteobacteria bacterium]